MSSFSGVSRREEFGVFSFWCSYKSPIVFAQTPNDKQKYVNHCCKTIKFFCPSLRITQVAVLRQLDYGSRSEMQFAGGCVARIWPINERQPDSSFQQWYYSTGSLFPLMHTRIVCNGRPTSLLWPRRTS